jgi:hypothetical protein
MCIIGALTTVLMGTLVRGFREKPLVVLCFAWKCSLTVRVHLCEVRSSNGHDYEHWRYWDVFPCSPGGVCRRF